MIQTIEENLPSNTLSINDTYAINEADAVSENIRLTNSTLSPLEVRSFPKASPRQNTRKTRKKRQTEILTPIKEQLRKDREQAKEKKQKYKRMINETNKKMYKETESVLQKKKYANPLPLKFLIFRIEGYNGMLGLR